jgi:peptide deformylase
MGLVAPGDPILRRETERFNFSEPPVDPVELARDLVETLRELGGLGLSANQVGLPWSVFAMQATPYLVCFNPRIVYRSPESTSLEEGCMSFPGLTYKASRPNTIRVRFQTPNGNVTTQTYNGMTARVFCHEEDHISGRLPFEGIGRLRMERALKRADRAGRNYHGLNLMKVA